MKQRCAELIPGQGRACANNAEDGQLVCGVHRRAAMLRQGTPRERDNKINAAFEQVRIQREGAQAEATWLRAACEAAREDLEVAGAISILTDVLMALPGERLEALRELIASASASGEAETVARRRHAAVSNLLLTWLVRT